MTTEFKEAHFNTWSMPLTSLDSSYRVMQPNILKILHVCRDLKEFRGCKTAGWIQEECGHNSKRWIKIACERWDCPDCSKVKFNKELARIRKAVKFSSLHLNSPLKFLTLTFKEDTDLETARRSLQKFVRKIRRKFGTFEYAKAPEETKKGRLHLHLVVIMPYIPQDWLQKAWGSIVDVRAVRCKPCYKKNSPNCRHHDKAGFEGAEELIKYMSKNKKGKLTHSRNFPKADQYKSRSGECSDCGKEHTFTYQKDAREQTVEFASVPQRPISFSEWIGTGVPLYKGGKRCDCWIVDS